MAMNQEPDWLMSQAAYSVSWLKALPAKTLSPTSRNLIAEACGWRELTEPASLTVVAPFQGAVSTRRSRSKEDQPPADGSIQLPLVAPVATGADER